MTAEQKKLKLLETRLSSENATALLDTILKLRTEAPCKGAVALLARLYNSSSDKPVKKAVEEFMNDMKESSLRTEVIDEIKKDYKKDTVRMLVASCWQSGLDYSEYAADFALAFNSGDFETALECFTVIEGSVPELPRKTKDHIIIILQENVEKVSADKTALMRQLVTMLE
jgi:hypothetical protein